MHNRWSCIMTCIICLQYRFLKYNGCEIILTFSVDLVPHHTVAHTVGGKEIGLTCIAYARTQRHSPPYWRARWKYCPFVAFWLERVADLKIHFEHSWGPEVPPTWIGTKRLNRGSSRDGDKKWWVSCKIGLHEMKLPLTSHKTNTRSSKGPLLARNDCPIFWNQSSHFGLRKCR